VVSASTIGSEEGGSAIRVVPERVGVAAVCLDGEFDMANASLLSDEIEETLASGDDLILDLSQATFIDSSVIHVLFASARAAAARGRRLVLQVGTAPIVERALELAAIERVVARAHDREEAVRLLQQQTPPPSREQRLSVGSERRSHLDA
jgi:anti-anti-sigma factor